MKDFLINIFQSLGWAWWVEIVTDKPRCTYYFGPFLSDREANVEQNGFIQDLEEEGARVLKVTVKRCKPANLTIYDDESGERFDRKPKPELSGQPS